MKFGKCVTNKQTDGGFKAMKVNSKEAKQINSQNDMLKKFLSYNFRADSKTSQSRQIRRFRKLCIQRAKWNFKLFDSLD